VSFNGGDHEMRKHEGKIESTHSPFHTHDPQTLRTKIRIVFYDNVCWLLLSFEDVPVKLRF